MLSTDPGAAPDPTAPAAMTPAEAHEAIRHLRERLAALEAAHPDAAHDPAGEAGRPDGPLPIRSPEVTKAAGPGGAGRLDNLQAALHVSRTGTYRLFPRARTLEADAALRSLFDLEDVRGTVPTDRFLDRIHPDDRARVESTIRRRLVAGGEETLEYRIVLADGRVRWMLDKARTARDAAGAALHLVGACTDITNRKEAEEALRRSEERFRSLVEASSAIVWTVAASGVVEDELTGWTAFTGQPFASHGGWGWLDAVHPDDRAATEAAWRRAVERNEPYVVRHRLRRADGVYRHMLARAVPVVEDGVVQEWVGTHTDLTDVVRAETELRTMNETLEARVAERTRALTAANEGLRAAQEAASLAYRRLRGIIDSTEDYVAAFDRGFALTVFNGAYADEVERTFGVRPWLGVTPDVFEARLDAAHRPLIEQTRARWERVLEGETFAFEQAIPHPDGTARYVESRYSPIRDEAGAVVGGVTLVREITDRYEAQQAVERNEAHFREALSGSQVVLARMDRERRYEWIHNPRLPIAYEQILGRRDEDLFGVDEVRELIALKEEVVRTGQPLRRELTFTFGEAPRTYDLTAAPLRGPDGAIVGLTTASLDVTEHREAREALAHSEALYRTLITSMSEGVILYGPDGTVIASNPAAERILGLSGEALRGRTPADLVRNAVREDGRPYLPDEYPAVFALRTGDAVLNETMGLPGPKGERIWLSVNAQPLRHRAAVEGVVVTFRDITEAKEAEEQLARTNRELEQRNRELHDFAYVASHDLQEPLRKIRAFADLLAKGLEARAPSDADEELHLYLDRVQHAAARMSQLITDLLAFSRVQTRGRAFRAVDLEATLEEVLADLEVRIAETGGEVATGPLPSIEADPMQMRQLLQNLVGNALKFHRPDVPPVVTIRARCERRPRPGGGTYEACVLEVEDNGIGFEERYTDRIFAPFQRLHGRSAYEGTGMGLAICRRIAERHGGDITARSEPGEGATFAVTLPVYQRA